MFTKFQQKILNSVVLGAHQSSIVFEKRDKKPGFLKTIELGLDFCMRFCITLFAIWNYKKSLSIKPTFILTSWATLIQFLQLQTWQKSFLVWWVEIIYKKRFKFFPSSFKCVEITFLCALYEQSMRHFFFLIFISS